MNIEEEDEEVEETEMIIEALRLLYCSCSSYAILELRHCYYQ